MTTDPISIAAIAVCMFVLGWLVRDFLGSRRNAPSGFPDPKSREEATQILVSKFASYLEYAHPGWLKCQITRGENGYALCTIEGRGSESDNKPKATEATFL